MANQGKVEDAEPANQESPTRHAANEKPTVVAEAAALANQGKVEDVEPANQERLRMRYLTARDT
jgi:hypothetical protein